MLFAASMATKLRKKPGPKPRLRGTTRCCFVLEEHQAAWITELAQQTGVGISEAMRTILNSVMPRQAYERHAPW